MRAERDRAWIGVDIGKTHHWVCAVDENGQKLLSLKVLNDETQILEVTRAVSALAADRRWAIDILGTPSALLLALLAQAGRAGALRLRASRGGHERGLHGRRQDRRQGCLRHR